MIFSAALTVVDWRSRRLRLHVMWLLMWRSPLRRRLIADPEFASALVGYLEWGTRLAVINSQPGAKVWENAPMPKWGWGETGGPWIPKKAQ